MFVLIGKKIVLKSVIEEVRVSEEGIYLKK